MTLLTRPSSALVPSLGGGYRSQHRGLDYPWGAGRHVYAAATGVLSVDETIGYGLRASIDHGLLVGGQRTVTRYAHLSRVVNRGDVRQGQLIGEMGSTGSFAKGVHLHFELLLDWVRVDPTSFFSRPAPPPPIPPQQQGEPLMAFRMIRNQDNGSIAITDGFRFDEYAGTDPIGVSANVKAWGSPVNVSAVEYERLKSDARSRDRE